MPSEWQFGSIREGGWASSTIRVMNTTAGEVTLSVVSTCDCLRSDPEKLVIGSHETGDIRLSFHAAEDYVGPIKMTYIIETNVKDHEAIYFRVRGNVLKKSN
jgi:hypothetical protein